MFRRLSVGAAAIAAIGASIAVGAPNAAAAPVGGPFFAGVYPSEDALVSACRDGARQGRWDICLTCPEVAGQVDLWVAVSGGQMTSPLPSGCRVIRYQ
ncbi:hypothetical protein [Amycolatopsis pigmentata]|uniref:Secreted protein n=1 Tax=Amycolatopsis pigmentata TaxID=450801 RepID=A0ABW5FR65_9PSEU